MSTSAYGGEQTAEMENETFKNQLKSHLNNGTYIQTEEIYLQATS